MSYIYKDVILVEKRQIHKFFLRTITLTRASLFSGGVDTVRQTIYLDYMYNFM